MSALNTIESFLEITICESTKQAKEEHCNNCPVITCLKDLLTRTKKEKLLRINEQI